MTRAPASPRDTRPSQDALTELTACVRARSFRRVRNLRLSLRDGGLVITGRADSYYAKQLAQHALLTAAVLPLRANEIVVD